jgi:hypothetical protein
MSWDKARDRALSLRAETVVVMVRYSGVQTALIDAGMWAPFEPLKAWVLRPAYLPEFAWGMSKP